MHSTRVIISVVSACVFLSYWTRARGRATGRWSAEQVVVRRRPWLIACGLHDRACPQRRQPNNFVQSYRRDAESLWAGRQPIGCGFLHQLCGRSPRRSSSRGSSADIRLQGGPGAASAFLHLGLVGPKILDFGPTERDAANSRLVDNPQSWLAFTDLVLIDPVGTGWSRAAKPDEAKNFYGVQQDAQAIAKTIALYIAHSGRVSLRSICSAKVTAACVR